MPIFLMKIMVIMVIIMVQRIFTPIELNIPSLKISWQIQQMSGIGIQFLWNSKRSSAEHCLFPDVLLKTKEECVFPTAIVLLLPHAAGHAEFGKNDY